jgi:ribose-phosphate pyrophosphokinase
MSASAATANVFFQTPDWGVRVVGPVITWQRGVYPDGEVWIHCDPPVDRYEQLTIWARFVGSRTLNDQVIELALLIGRMKHYADDVTLFAPYLPYSLQDREAHPGEAEGYDRVAALWEAAGLQHVIIYDTHAERNLQSWHIPVEHRSAARALADAVQMKMADLPHTAIIAPDKGATARAQILAEDLHLPSFTLLKERQGPGAVTINAQILSHCPAKHLIIVDDLINTGGTLVKAAQAIHETCHPQTLAVLATHGPLVEGVIQRMMNAGINRVFTTDSFLLRELSGAEQPLTDNSAHTIVSLVA